MKCAVKVTTAKPVANVSTIERKSIILAPVDTCIYITYARIYIGFENDDTFLNTPRH